jgi:hypothetical protein
MELNELQESLRTAFGRNVPVRRKPNGSGISFDFTPDDIKALIRQRPEAEQLKALQQNRSLADEFLSTHATSTDSDDCILSCGLLRGRAD